MRKPCGKLSLEFLVRNSLPLVELVETLLDGRKQIHAPRDFVQGGVIRKFADGVEHKFFLRHGGSMNVSCLRGKNTGSRRPASRFITPLHFSKNATNSSYNPERLAYVAYERAVSSHSVVDGLVSLTASISNACVSSVERPVRISS